MLPSRILFFLRCNITTVLGQKEPTYPQSSDECPFPVPHHGFSKQSLIHSKELGYHSQTLKGLKTEKKKKKKDNSPNATTFISRITRALFS